MTRRILSIDIGGTRIKASVIITPLSIERLKNTKVYAFRNIGWLNEHLPRIVDPDHWASITNHTFKLDSIDAIAIDGPWRVSNNMIKGYYPEVFKIPYDLKDKLEKYSGKNVICNQNDATAWLKGMIQYLTLTNSAVPFPVLCLVFGTGIGSAYAKSLREINGFEVSELSVFQQLRTIEHFNNNWEVHRIFTDREQSSFFRKVRDDDNRRSWDYDRVREKYTKRVVALIQDIKSEKSLKPQTVFIGGGFSEYISQRMITKDLGIDAKVFRSLDLGINPDLLPLLGNV